MNNKTKNIVLIGMPGCGKSTVGKFLARAVNRPLADIDILIEERAGKSITRIFAEDGEEEFRRLETRVLGEECAKSGIVIAAGGGIVTRSENLDLLRQNSVVVYLKRDLKELAVNGRPLSGSVGIDTLAKQRLHLYEKWSDYKVQAENSPQETAMRVLQAIDFPVNDKNEII